MKIIDGNKIAERIKDEITIKITEACGVFSAVRPSLAIILVGEREDSKLYVALKEKEAIRVGIDTHVYRCDEIITEEKLIELVEFLNNDDQVDAILIQLPLPQHLNTNKIIETIKPEKDADGFHPKNLEKFLTTRDIKFMPPLYAVIMEILKDINFDVKEKQICIIANSKTFGDNLAKVLESYKAKVLITSANKENLSEKTSKADVLISAVGRPHFIKKDFIKKDAAIIDIGITKQDKKILGDVDSEDVEDVAGYLTPVPGGVGPITIAMLFKNTLRLYLERKKN
ncbi:bifunctional 5,10-methylenetetrahydrofolate dehydrogenase/5,10-methenyltetrahydrofolate cyclohydrolase [Patescibacteria group bacterium]|nr:bifunctional 5,10-methylenetetrahydrofolate dehydrogenase/5,10-methenyltetrahydrofolate cyclohydrolase [Patescibacteria group bacterium]